MGVRTRVAAVAACASLLALGGASDSWAGPDWRQCPGTSQRPSADSLNPIAFSVYCILNAERIQYGLKPLRWNWRLRSAAQGMGNDMVTSHFFSHDEPDGRGLAARVAVTGYLPASNDWVLGENLGWGEGATATPAAIVYGWMVSPGHRENILDPEFEEIGIACVPGSPLLGHTGGDVYVAEFGFARSLRKASKLQRRR